MHDMERDWKKNITYCTKKNPVALYITSLPDKKQASLSHATSLEGYLSTGSLKSWRHMKTRTQEDKKLGLPFLFIKQMEKLFYAKCFKPGYCNQNFIKKLINNPSKKPINRQQMDLTVTSTP